MALNQKISQVLCYFLYLSILILFPFTLLQFSFSVFLSFVVPLLSLFGFSLSFSGSFCQSFWSSFFLSFVSSFFLSLCSSFIRSFCLLQFLFMYLPLQFIPTVNHNYLALCHGSQVVCFGNEFGAGIKSSSLLYFIAFKVHAENHNHSRSKVGPLSSLECERGGLGTNGRLTTDSLHLQCHSFTAPHESALRPCVGGRPRQVTKEGEG